MAEIGYVPRHDSAAVMACLAAGTPSFRRSDIMKRPNILFVFPDQWRGDWVGAISPGLPLRTPNIDALIARGIGFRQAWTPSPLCVPARSCLATGRSYGRVPAPDNQCSNPLDTDNFYRRLTEAGYAVASFGKTDLFKPDKSWGKDGRHRVGGVDRLARFGITAGRDMAGKHDSSQAAALDCADPYTDRLARAGLIEVYLRDLAARSEDSPLPVADWEAGRVALPETCYANVRPSPLPPRHYADNVVGQEAVDYLRAVDSAEPWFAMVNFPGPHEPMDVTEAMVAEWEGVRFPPPMGRSIDDAELQNEIRRRYAAMLENIDRWLGSMIDTLARRGILNDTIILFASDHGEMLGDRNLWKKQVPYEPSVRVPMIWSGPGIQAGELVDDAPASLIDIPATLLSFAGAAPLATSDGRDLTGYLAGREAYPRAYAHSGLGEWRAVTDGRWKLVLGYRKDLPLSKMQFGTFQPSDGSGGQLFDLRADPWEQSNLWDTNCEARERLRFELLREARSA